MRGKLLLTGLLSAIACVEGGNLAISAGAPVTAAVRGQITDCGTPVSGAEVALRVTQNEPGQARPVDDLIGPITAGRDGRYLIEVGPAFAIPGPVTVQLRVAAGGVTQEIPGLTLQLTLGLPARDTVRLDADLGVERRVC
ncbi:MAG: hypothetical protein ACJ8BF_14480 [Gemmatimonadales bacterium]